MIPPCVLWRIQHPLPSLCVRSMAWGSRWAPLSCCWTLLRETRTRLWRSHLRPPVSFPVFQSPGRALSGCGREMRPSGAARIPWNIPYPLPECRMTAFSGSPRRRWHRWWNNMLSPPADAAGMRLQSSYMPQVWPRNLCWTSGRWKSCLRLSCRGVIDRKRLHVFADILPPAGNGIGHIGGRGNGRGGVLGAVREEHGGEKEECWKRAHKKLIFVELIVSSELTFWNKFKSVLRWGFVHHVILNKFFPRKDFASFCYKNVKNRPMRFLFCFINVKLTKIKWGGKN